MKAIKVHGHGSWQVTLGYDTEPFSNDEYFWMFIDLDYYQYEMRNLPVEYPKYFFNGSTLKEEFQRKLITSPEPVGFVRAVVTRENDEDYTDELDLFWYADIKGCLDGVKLRFWNDRYAEKALQDYFQGITYGEFEEEVLYRVETQVYCANPVVGTVFLINDMFGITETADYVYNGSIVYENMSECLPALIDIHPELKQAMDDAVKETSNTEMQSGILWENNCTGETLVGPFFYIHGCMIIAGIPLSLATLQADKLGNPMGHEELFDTLKLKGDYIDFPRGRVIWDCTNRRGIIYIDPCIKDRAEEVARKFHLQECVLEEDEHYHCKNCSGGVMREWNRWRNER